MSSELADSPVDTRRLSLRSRTVLLGVVLVALVAVVVVVVAAPRRAGAESLPLRMVGEISLPGDTSRLDYPSLDPGRALLFVAHLGASEVIEVDLAARRAVRTIPNLSQVHGVLVVPAVHRVYASATGANSAVILDEATAAVLAQTPTGDYPDGLAYDPGPRRLYVAAEDGTVSILDQRGRATVLVGSGHLADGAHVVAVDPISHHSFYPVPHGADGHPALLEMEPTQ
jgi:YVTN family beta-propeller protein